LGTDWYGGYLPALYGPQPLDLAEMLKKDSREQEEANSGRTGIIIDILGIIIDSVLEKKRTACWKINLATGVELIDGYAIHDISTEHMQKWFG
jgi:hypothetical protein